MVIKTVAEDKLKEMNMEVVDMLELLNRVRKLESQQQKLNFCQVEVNKTLDLHEVELINQATNTFIAQQSEVDKELILRGLPFDRLAAMQVPYYRMAP